MSHSTWKTLWIATAFGVAGSACYGSAIYNALVPGVNTLAANDDGSSPSTALGFTANYFGTSYSSLFVNNNGNVTFGSALGTYIPFGLSGATATPIIAPFFADVDTRGAGSGLVTYGITTFLTNDGVLRNAFVANWIDVGYYLRQTNPRNSFQLLLVEIGSGDFDIVFNYGSILWETGTGSSGGGLGGQSARVGYSAGTGNPGTFFEFAGSGVNGALLDGGPAATSLIQNSNVSASDPRYTRTNGRYVFNVRNGEVAGAGADIPEPSSVAFAGIAAAGFLMLRRRRRVK